MNEDRRNHPRLPIEHDVVLMCSELGFVKGRVMDLSRTGAYVKTGRISLFAEAYVGVCFVLVMDNNRELIKLDAQVVRTTDDGVGLYFADTSETLLQRFALH